ncbi:glutamate receptor ionotropic, delta-2-like [Scylla paramamosain]|uniref:glutamate receptor ionotropic, delta-2-like n=1 Tax=Scylla paramamosain TaxID=85552 RepID=UPI003083AC7A
MLNDIGTIYNFTYEIYVKPEDGMWGDLSNGTWRGMIGEVKREERDFCINVMAFTMEQFHVVDFSVPYTVDGFAVMLRNPLPPPRWWSIVFPLSWDTWVVLLIFVLLLPLPLYLLIKAHEESKASLSRMYLEVVRIILRQDAVQLSSAASVRIFSGTWWLAAMVLFISYTGNLVAYITVPAKPQMLTTVEQLVETDIIPMVPDYGTVAPAFLMASEDRTLRILGKKLLLISAESYQDGFDLLEEGRYAFLDGAEYLRYTAIMHRVTNVYFLKETFFPPSISWIFPKYTAWKHKFDLYLQRFVESGLIDFWKKWLTEDVRKKMNLTESKVDAQQGPRPLNLDDLKSIFFVYLVGILVVVVAGVLEL